MRLPGWLPFQRKEAIVRSIDLWNELQKEGASGSGRIVNYKTAMQATVAMACARVIANGLSQVPFKLFRDAGGKKLPATDHPLYELLTLKPNDWQTSFEFREQIALHLVFCGSAYVWKNQPGANIYELLPLEPQRVTVKRDGWNLRYFHRVDGKAEQEIPAKEIWHLRGPSWDGWMGLDGVKLAREALGLALATELYGAKLFENGAQVSGLLTTDNNLSPEQRQQIRKSWDETHQGAAKAGRMGLVWGGLKFQSTTAQNDQAQFLETRRFQLEEVCRAIGVMPIMVGHADKAATYASAEQMFLAHAVHTLGPWYMRIEQSADANLLTRDERAAGLYTKFVANGLMRGSAQTRADYFAKLYGIGAINPNEIRALEDMNPYEGGDEYRVPLNMADPSAPPVAATPSTQTEATP